LQLGACRRDIAPVAIEEGQRDRDAGDDGGAARDAELAHAKLHGHVGVGEALLHRHRPRCGVPFGLRDAHRRRLHRVDGTERRLGVEPIQERFRQAGEGSCHAGKRRQPCQRDGLERARVFEVGLKRVEFGFRLHLPEPGFLAGTDQRAGNLQVVGRLLNLVLGDGDAPIGDLCTGIGACQLGRIDKAAIAIARLCRDDAGFTGGDPGRSLTPSSMG
jgi:hypothetical protein